MRTITIHVNTETEEHTVTDSANEFDQFSSFDETEARHEAESWMAVIGEPVEIVWM